MNPRPSAPRPASQWWVAAQAALTAVALAASVSAAAAQPDTRKFDHDLRQRIAEAPDSDAPVKVIVRVKPSARAGFSQRLRTRGARAKSDFSVINGSAAEMTPRQLRALADDTDVLSISVDADVAASGVATSVTGTATNGRFSLRGAVGLRSMSPTSTTKSFQHGASGYASTTDTGIDGSMPTSGMGNNATVTMRGTGNAQAGMFVRFDNMFGSGAGQIPYGSTILSASLRVEQVSSGVTTASMGAYRMLVDWDNFTTYNSLTTSGIGLQLNNVEAASTADATLTNLNPTGYKTFSSAGIAAAVQSWADGQPNRGWVLWQNTINGFSLSTREAATVASRPLLTVTYKAPVENTSVTGAGVTIAVVDSGLFEDGGGTTRIKTTRDFTTGLTNPPHLTTPSDGYGHGTHVAGLIGGNKAEVLGIAPGVQFVSLKVLNSAGVGSTSHVINAIQWAIANKTTYGIDVLNLSLGHPVFEAAATDPLVQAVESAVRAGITVVVAAGNMGINPGTLKVGYAGLTSPGNAPSAITVGSSRTMNTVARTDDVMSDFSSRGPTWYDAFQKPDLVAPGQFVASAATTAQTLYTALPTLRARYGGRAYLNLSGTSMAAGVVSGTVALMIEQSKLTFGGVRPKTNTIKAMLQRSAIPLKNASGVRYDTLTQGAGSLNALGAVQLAAALDPRAAVGTTWVAGTIPLTTTIDGQVIGWNDNIVWGTNVLWGDTLNTRLSAWNDNVVWGTEDNVVWGTSLPSHTADDNIVWGTNYGWADNVVWGTNDNVVWGTNDDNVVWGTRDYLVIAADDNVVWGTSLATPAP